MTVRRGFGRFCVSGANRQLGSTKEVLAMPRMPKYLKEELAFFLDERGRKKYNELCRNGMTGSKKNASRFCRHWNTFQSWWRSL